MTPYKAWKGSKPKVSHLRVFGCIAYAMIHSHSWRKLDEKSEKCIFVGYSTQSKGYKLYNRMSGKVVISRDVIFNEVGSWDWCEGQVQQGVTVKDPLFEKPNSAPTSSPTNTSVNSPVGSAKNSATSS